MEPVDPQPIGNPGIVAEGLATACVALIAAVAGRNRRIALAAVEMARQDMAEMVFDRGIESGDAAAILGVFDACLEAIGAVPK